MKFAEHLSAHITPEWRKQYIQYEHMKEMLYDAIDSIPIECQEHEFLEIVRKFDEQFLHFCEKELNKINSFFAEKLAEAVRKFNDLKNELDSFIPGSADQDQFDVQFTTPPLFQQSKEAQKKQSRKLLKKINDLKLAFSEFYLNLVLLQNYQTLNFTGFRKILKKHDKLLNTSAGNQWRQNNVDQAPFYTNKEVDKLIEKTENIFANVLEGGNRSRAMKRLRVPPLNAQQSLWTTFRVGFYSGLFIILSAALIIQLIYAHDVIKFNYLCHLFRGPFFIWLFIFLLGINVYGWRTSGVNHVLIFELDPRDHISEQHLFEVSFFFAVIWAFALLGYSFASSFEIDGNLFPLATVVLFILFLINPTKTFRHTARFWLLRVLYRLLVAPFYAVTFADFWLADQLNSLSILFGDAIFYIFFYTNVYYLNSDHNALYMPHGKTYLTFRAFFAALPAWFRFVQCLRRYRDDNYRSLFPHVVNAGKYSTTFFVITFSTLTELTSTIPGDPSSSSFFQLWIAALIISSIYTYSWDVIMDWGLMNVRSTENWLLRNELVYPKHYYHMAYIGDFFGRTMWAFTISLNQVGNINSDWLGTGVATIELFRRFVWNFFRLENEHLNNCGEFRAVRDISIAPITLSSINSQSNGFHKTSAIFKKKDKKNHKPRRSTNQYSIKRSQDDSKSSEVTLLMETTRTITHKDYDKL
ncbi:Xenotropic and polytropic retrovirus receptor 1 [Dermatophagoides pteronyssinus]|uniref:Xenotropic and polytropic retrovirus receptor 1 n=1 Tax=Dermatophagoides pteronyssinus TaxID=6956 RepID=A0ABQ8JA69_DERPT|nr:Xenotropic and polytropic retrovirus receptor 1 [Dermatophagoides pteronyssinus]